MYTKVRFLSIFVLVCLLATLPSSYAQAQSAMDNANGVPLTNPYTDVQSAPRAAVVSTGMYDDTNSNWVYSAGWTTYTGSGPYNNTIHYTTTVGASATIQFSGTRFTLTFTKNTNRGSIRVLVDGIEETTFSANHTSLAWQQTYASGVYPMGTHTLRIEHAGVGTHIDIDAVKIYGYVPAGTYDDNNENWAYSGNWIKYTGTGPYNNTIHYTDTVGSYAELVFSGTRFVLTFTKHANRGVIRVDVVDPGGIGIFNTTIDANNPTIAWQQTYTSPTFPAGVHTVRLTYESGSNYIDVDAIQIFGPVSAGIYDDTNSNWSYSTGDWTSYTSDGPYNRTIHYTTTIGGYAELAFNGVRFTLTFTKNTNRGWISVLVDGNPVTTIDANSPTLAWQQTYKSPIYPAGDHVVRLEYGGVGDRIDIDAIQIHNSVPAGTYDDTNENWVYSDNWISYTGSGPYNNTIHYTNTIGSYAELGFNGTRFILTFTKDSNRGSIRVLVDGVEETIINANNPSQLWQQSYTSLVYPAGNHRLRLEYSAGGSVIDVDTVQVHNASTPASAGTYDDTNSNWSYSSGWILYTATGPYNNTIHYTNGTDNYAEFQFIGTRFTLTFTKNTNRGSIRVLVDGTSVTTIDAYSASMKWQQSYTSPKYLLGIHTVRLEHAGGRPIIDVDAIKIEGTLPSGTYDDSHSGWAYSGAWLTYSGAGPYNNTLHYTTMVGDYAEFGFNGTKFTFTFTKYPNRGLIEVRVDNVYVTTIDASNPTTLWRQTYISPTYTSGAHIVRFTHAGGGGGVGTVYIDVDSITITP